MNKKALVISIQRDRYELLSENEKLFGRLKKSVFYNKNRIVDFPTVGDEVGLEPNPYGDSMIVSVEDRKSVFTRVNSTQGLPDQAVAANFDYVFIVTSLNRDFNLSKLERYLTAAWTSGGTPVIILTKKDLCDDPDYYEAQAASAAPGVNIHIISSYTGEGMAQLKEYLSEGKSVVLLGSSGVGKSSLVNSLLGKEETETGAIREYDAQGRHTTTYKMTYFLPKEIKLPDGSVIEGGGRIIDTPGMRKLLVGEAENGIAMSFSDIEELIQGCRFSDCSHTKEPGCAVKAALEDGSLDAKRWQTYLSIQQDGEFSRERKNAMMKRISKLRRKL